MREITFNFIHKFQKIIIYCAGNHGVYLSQILEKCNIRVDYFVDNDPKKWNRYYANGILCLKPTDIPDKNTCLVFICVAHKYYHDIYIMARNNGFSHIIFLGDFFDYIIRNNRLLFFDIIKFHATTQKIDPFYTIFSENIKMPSVKYQVNDKIAVYTGIFGDYDKLHPPLFHANNIDYFYISEHQINNDSCFNWIDASQVIPESVVSPIEKNRFVKMYPHIIFSSYRYSVYMDGNIGVLGDVSSMVPECATGIAAFKHPERDCIYYEGITVANLKRIPVDIIINHLERYLEEGYPLHFGLPEMSVILRDHHNLSCHKIMNCWWNEFKNGIQRDQLSFMYAIWKNGFKISDISSLGDDVRSCSFLHQYQHTT